MRHKRFPAGTVYISYRLSNAIVDKGAVAIPSTKIPAGRTPL